MRLITGHTSNASGGTKSSARHRNAQPSIIIGYGMTAVVKVFGCRPPDGGSVRSGPASANLQGRKPREVWRGLASDAMGISTLARCVECLFGRPPMRRRARLTGGDMRDRNSAVVIERQDGYRGRRKGEHDHCWSRTGEADGQPYNFAAHRT